MKGNDPITYFNAVKLIFHFSVPFAFASERSPLNGNCDQLNHSEVSSVLSF